MGFSRVPGVDPSVFRRSGIWGAADEAVFNKVLRKNPFWKFNRNLSHWVDPSTWWKPKTLPLTLVRCSLAAYEYPSLACDHCSECDCCWRWQLCCCCSSYGRQPSPPPCWQLWRQQLAACCSHSSGGTSGFQSANSCSPSPSCSPTEKFN